MIGSEPTGKVTGLTNRMGWTPKHSIPIEVDGFDIPCILQLRWAATVLDLIFFLGECSSNGKVRDLGWAALFPSAKGSPGMSGEGSKGRRGSLSFRMFILLISLSSPVNNPC